MRKLARIVKIDAIQPIPNADAIEIAKIGGWSVVVKKAEFSVGDVAVYFEIDTFLPEGNPAWQFLVEKSSRIYNGVNGHVLKSIRLRKQLSQGLLISPKAFEMATGGFQEPFSFLPIGTDVSELLGVSKYEPPIPANLAGVQRGNFPSIIPKTDQERIQNLTEEFNNWSGCGELLTWEVTEKLEGSSCTFAWINDDLHVCSRNIDLVDTVGNSFWGTAHALSLPARMHAHFKGRNIALQGELIGFGIQGNIYKLNKQEFYLFDVYDADLGRYLNPTECNEIANSLSLTSVPVVETHFVLPNSMEAILSMADGPSKLLSTQKREGLVFKCNDDSDSFKAISNAYLLA
jgi:RNA ligase (TIGR02306 family)